MKLLLLVRHLVLISVLLITPLVVSIVLWILQWIVFGSESTSITSSSTTTTLSTKQATLVKLYWLSIRCWWLVIELIGLAVLLFSFFFSTTQEQSETSPLNKHVQVAIVKNVEEYFVPTRLKTSASWLKQRLFTGGNPADKMDQNHTSTLVYEAAAFLWHATKTFMKVVTLFISGPGALGYIIAMTIIREWGLSIMIAFWLRVVPAAVLLLFFRLVLPYTLFQLYFHTILFQTIFRYTGLLFILTASVAWPLLSMLLYYSPLVRSIWFIMIHRIFSNQKGGFTVNRVPDSSVVKYEIELSQIEEKQD
jgi:hypothetical protein